MNALASHEILATGFFAVAVLHTFLVKKFQHIAHRFPKGSSKEVFFHLLGEIEVVFGFWSAVFLIGWVLADGVKPPLDYIESRDFTEPFFVFVVLAVCSTRPILEFATRMVQGLARLLPVDRTTGFYFSALTVGPLLGSLITEPAAMTVTALMLLDHFYKKSPSYKFMYATIGLLFVNVSIGGTLTPFAAPPVLMVASKWNWDIRFMLLHFGWKAIIAIVISTVFVIFRFRSELQAISAREATTHPEKTRAEIPAWVMGTHLLFLALIVLASHHDAVFVGVFLFFLGLVSVTQRYQERLKLKEGLLVAFFLGGLVVLGAPQRWWIEPVLTQLSSLPLYLGAISLTAITDNAALTYLGAQVPSLSETSKYALVAGSVVGGGLTVIANAPNPVGYGILSHSFGKDGVSPGGLLLSALPPTVIAALCFWLL